MANERKQLSTWVSADEAAKIEAAAEADSRSVSAWLRLIALEKTEAPKQVSA